MDNAVAQSDDDLEHALDAACGKVCPKSGLEFGGSIQADHRALLRRLAAGTMAARSHEDLTVTCVTGIVHGLGFSIGFTAFPDNVGFLMLPVVACACEQQPFRKQTPPADRA